MNGMVTTNDDTFVLDLINDGYSVTVNFNLNSPDERDRSDVAVLERDLDEVVGARFRELSEEWTTTAISFFEKVPQLTFFNFVLADAELTMEVTQYVEGRALSSEKTEVEGTTVQSFVLPRKEIQVLSKKLGRTTPSRFAAKSLARAGLAALVSEYEAFIGNLLRALAQKFPDKFISETDQISFRDFSRFTSIEEARFAMIEGKIEDILHDKSHHEVLAWIEGAFGVNLTEDKKLLSEFIEVCQRRHILMHGNGIVSKRYIKNCLSAKADPNSLPKIGEQLHVDRKYLRRATARVFQFGYFTLHIIWQKVIAKQSEKSVQCCLDASHDFLDRDLTKMSRRVCDFVLSSKTKVSDRHHAYFVINRAQSFLFDSNLTEDERQDGISATLQKRDWTMVSPTVQLALACVKRDFSNLEALTAAAVASGLDYYAAQTWSVFREVREMDVFMKHFHEGSE